MTSSEFKKGSVSFSRSSIMSPWSPSQYVLPGRFYQVLFGIVTYTPTATGNRTDRSVTMRFGLCTPEACAEFYSQILDLK